MVAHFFTILYIMGATPRKTKRRWTSPFFRSSLLSVPLSSWWYVSEATMRPRPPVVSLVLSTFIPIIESRPAGRLARRFVITVLCCLLEVVACVDPTHAVGVVVARLAKVIRRVAQVALDMLRLHVAAIRTDDQRRHTGRSEEHTSELQSRENLVCRLLLEK